MLRGKIYFQNDGEVNSFEVHVLNNDNKAIQNVWVLVNPANQDEWVQGKVEIVPGGEKEYQVLRF